jgi:hypothetical protein
MFDVAAMTESLPEEQSESGESNAGVERVMVVARTA